MERQNQILTALAILLLVLMAVVVLDKDAGKDTTDDEDGNAPASRDLFDYEDKDIDKIVVKARGGETTLEKKDGVWAMTSPKELPVEERRAAEIAERLNTVRIEERALTGNPDDFGLGEADRAEITLYAGDKSYAIVVGKDAPVGYRTYAQETPGGPVHLLSSRVADITHRGPDDFRSKDVWDFSTAAVRRIRIEDAGRTVTLRKDDSGWWVGDEGPRADDDAVSAWLSKATTLKIASFEESADAAALGLEPARGSITVEDGEKTWTITLGTGSAARVSGALVRLGDGLTDLVKLDGWTGKKLMPVQRYATDAIDVKLGDVSARLQSQEGAWSDANGRPFGGSDAIFDAIEAIEADRSVPVPAPVTTWGRITLSDGDTHTAVLLGELGADGRRVARDEAGGPGFYVPQAGLDKLAGLLPKGP